MTWKRSTRYGRENEVTFTTEGGVTKTYRADRHARRSPTIHYQVR